MSLIEKALRQLEKDKQTASYGAYPGMTQADAAEEVYEKADAASVVFFSEEHEEPRLWKQRLIAGVVVVLGLGAAAAWYVQPVGLNAPEHAALVPQLKPAPVTVAPDTRSGPAAEPASAQQGHRNENKGSKGTSQQQPMVTGVQTRAVPPRTAPVMQDDPDRLKRQRIVPAPVKHLPQQTPALKQAAAARTVRTDRAAGATQSQRKETKEPLPAVNARAVNLLERDAENADSLNNQGVALLEQGSSAQARDYFAQALNLAPDHEKALNNMGLSLYAQGRPEEAFTYYQRALQINPDNIETHVNMGIALRSRRDFGRAAAVFQKALALNPAHPETLYNYGLLLRDMGQQEKSRSCFEQFLKAAPPHLQGVADNVRTYLQAPSVKKQ